MDSTHFCALDVETAGGSMHTFPAGFRLLVTGVREGSTYGMYTGALESTATLAEYLENFEGPIVTFNGSKFDLPMLDSWTRQALDRPLRVRHHYDLMTEITRAAGRRISLERVCLYTFGDQKVALGHHKHNARTWAEAPERLIEYNRQDVDLTYELFLRVLNNAYFFLGDTTVQLRDPSNASIPFPPS